MSTTENDLDIRPVYRAGLLHILSSCAHEGEPRSANGKLCTVKSALDAMELIAAIEPETHVVRECAYRNPTSPVFKGLLESVCRYMENRPIQECADHALIHVEFQLRGNRQPRHVPGIQTPSNADPAFRPVQKLVRGLLTEYRLATGYQGTDNFYVPPVSSAWADLDAEARVKALQKAIHRCSEELSLAEAGIRILSIQDEVRVTLDMAGVPDASRKQLLLMAIENSLRRSVGERLELYLPEKKDRNKIRRLAPDGKGKLHVGNE